MRPSWLRLTSPTGLAVAMTLVGLSSCGGGSTVEVTLQEFSIIPADESVDAGEVTFEAENIGPDDNHELVVIRTDLAPEALPTAENGTVDEGGEGIIEVIGEIEEFPPGETESATFTLEAGSYVLICNVFEEEESEAHYQVGMRVAFDVT
jgi:uncharacterized cupredoxin-like copper-binding protein